MTIQQNLAIWELLRQGLQQLASLAERCWEHGEELRLDLSPHLPRSVRTLVEQANRQALRH
jgi:hypothetical protein